MNKLNIKVPGSEKLTRPEELGCLSKYLGQIKNVQGEITKEVVKNSKLVKDRGHFPEINELNDSIVEPDKSIEDNLSLNFNISNLEIDNSVELNNDINKLQVNDLDSLKDSLEKLDISDKNVELNNLVDNIKNIKPAELHDSVTPLVDNNPTKELDNMIEKITNQKSIELDDNLYQLNIPTQVELGNTLVNLKDNTKVSLNQSIENLNVEDNNSLDDSISVLMDNLKISLNDEILELKNLFGDLKLSDITVPVGKLPSDITLSEYVNKLSPEDRNIILENYISTLESKEDIVELGNFIDNLQNNIDSDLLKYKISNNIVYKGDQDDYKVEKLSEFVDELENTSSDSELNSDIESLKHDDLLELDETVVKNSLNHEIVGLGDVKVKSPVDSLLNERKDFLSKSPKEKDNWLFNFVMNMIDAVSTKNGNHLGYSHNSIERWQNNLKSLVSLYLSGNVTKDVYINFGEAMDSFYDEVEKKNLLNTKRHIIRDPFLAEKNDLLQSYILEKNVEKKVIYRRDKPEIPKIGEGDFFTVAKQYGRESLRYVIRKRAEEFVSSCDFLSGSEKAKALSEVLVYLSQFSDYYEKIVGTHVGLLPGDSTKNSVAKKIINTLWRTTGNVLNTVDNVRNSNDIFTKSAAITAGSIVTGADAIAGLGINSKGIKNRPKLKDNKSKSKFVGLLKTGISKIANINISSNREVEEAPDNYEVANKRPRLPKNVSESESKFLGLNKAKIDIPYGNIDKNFDINSSSYGKGNLLNFRNEYVSSEGILLTLHDLCNVNLDKDPIPGSLGELKQLLIDSPYITTVGKFGESKKGGFATYTLSDNSYWDVVIEPFVDEKLNGGWSYLPAIEEINLINQRLHGVHTGYSKWIPIINFDFERAKLVTKSASLFEGEIVYPVSAEMMNDLRITIVDDQYKSWSTYFRKCMEVSVYNSIPHSINYYKDSYSRMNALEPLLPTYIDRSSPATALYKNITFRIRIYIMTPQYSTIKSFDLLCVLKDFQESYTGTVDSGGAADVDLSFSVVGENPDAYEIPAKYYTSTKDIILNSLLVKVGRNDKGNNVYRKLSDSEKSAILMKEDYRKYIESNGLEGTRPSPDELKDFLNNPGINDLDNNSSTGTDTTTPTNPTNKIIYYDKSTLDNLGYSSGSNDFTVPDILT